MSGDALTIVVGAVGALVSLVGSIEFYRRGRRASHAELAEQHELLTNVVQQFSERAPSRSEIEQIVRQAGGDVSTAASVAASLDASDHKAAVAVLVRASLGALQDATGAVDLSRLLREVGSATGASYREVAEVLGTLRNEGLVGWDGAAEDLSAVRTLRVNPVRGAGQPQDAGGSTPDVTVSP